MDRSISVLSVRFSILAVCIVCMLAAIAGCSNRRSEQHRGQADIYLRQGNLEKAEENYRRAIASNSENALAHFGLGRTLSLGEKSEEALESFDRAIVIDATLTEAYERAAELQGSKGDIPGALARAEALTGVDREAGTQLHASVLREAKRPEEAIEVLRAFLGEGSDSSQIRLNLAVSYLSAGRAAEAEVELEGLLDRSDVESFPIHILLMESYRLQGKHEEMIAGLRDRVEARPEDVEAQLSLALGLLETGNIEEAEAITTPLLEQTPQSGPVNYVMGSCFIARKDFENAEKHLQIAQRAFPNDKGIAQRLALARSRGTLTTTAGTSRPTPGGTVARPTVEGWRALWDNGSLQQLLDSRDSLAVATEDEALYRETLALAALFAGDDALAMELGNALDSMSPVRRFIASARGVLERPVDEATAAEIKDLLASWEVEGDEARSIMKANAQGFILARLGFRAQAYTILGETYRRWPGNGVAWRNMATLYALAGMPKYRVASYRQLLATRGNHAETLRLLLGAMLDAGMEREAQTFVESTYALMPNDPEAIANLAQAYLRADSIPLAISILEGSVAEQPNESVLAIALATARLRAGDAQGALDALNAPDIDLDGALAGIEVGAFAEAHLGNWDRALARIGSAGGDSLSLKLQLLNVAALLAVDRRADAVAALPAGETLPRGDIHNDVRVSVSVLARALGQEVTLADATVVSLAEGLGEESSRQQLFAYAVAGREAQLYEQAYESFSQLYVAMNDQPELLAYVLDSLSEAGTVEDRVSIAEELAAVHETWPEGQLGLAAVYRAEGDAANRRDALVEATSLAPERVEGWQHLAEFASEQSDDALSLIAYQKLFNLEPGNPVALNNLAYYILKTKGDPQEALQYASKASELLPKVSGILHTLGLAQLEVGDLESSQGNLMQALTMQPGDPTLTLDFGRLLIELGKVEEGRLYVQRALTYSEELNVEFPRSAEAVKILAEE